jgi:hypothetical protein
MSSPNRSREEASFDSRVIACTSREEAQQEARRQQSQDGDAATWIYLEMNGQWIAKRTPTTLPTERRSWWERGADVVWSAFFGPGL